MERRRTALYLIIGISLLAGLITGRTFFFNVTYAFAGMLVFAFLWSWSGANWLRLARQTRARRAQVGRYLEERFTIRNTSVLPKLWPKSTTIPPAGAPRQPRPEQPGHAGHGQLDSPHVVRASRRFLAGAAASRGRRSVWSV
jgi:uncharacterized protein (DUF58 family)